MCDGPRGAEAEEKDGSGGGYKHPKQDAARTEHGGMGARSSPHGPPAEISPAARAASGNHAMLSMATDDIHQDGKHTHPWTQPFRFWELILRLCSSLHRTVSTRKLRLTSPCPWGAAGAKYKAPTEQDSQTPPERTRQSSTNGREL